MDYRTRILKAAHNYCEITGLQPATVATKVMNDGKFLERLSDGGGCTMDTYEKVMSWFKKNTPRNKSNRKDK